LSTIETWMMEFHALLEAKIPQLRSPTPPAQFG
jgi:hypothetical protein